MAVQDQHMTAVARSIVRFVCGFAGVLLAGSVYFALVRAETLLLELGRFIGCL